jgi:glycosyltransferase involved in cell wall biosynthesis
VTDAAEAIAGVSNHPFPSGTVIIPAHDEAKVIGRTLRPIAALAANGSIEVIVACNGCHDETPEIARSFAGMRVLELPSPSKVMALNAADAVATRWPRLYLDADVTIDPDALRDVFARLGHGDLLAARPPFTYDTSGASRLVRAFYRARRRIPSTNQAMWGAGAFAVSESGHRRFGEFPLISLKFSGDDLFVDHQFGADEKAVIETAPVRVRTPRHARSLLRTLRRNYRSQAELRDYSTIRRTTLELIGSIRSRRTAIDACIYAGFVSLARLRRPGAGVWERDDSARFDVSNSASDQ